MALLPCPTTATRCFGKFAPIRGREPFRKPAFLYTQWDWVLVPGKTVSWRPGIEILHSNLSSAQLLLFQMIYIAFGDTAWLLYAGDQQCHEWIVTFFSTNENKCLQISAYKAWLPLKCNYLPFVPYTLRVASNGVWLLFNIITFLHCLHSKNEAPV